MAAKTSFFKERISVKNGPVILDLKITLLFSKILFFGNYKMYFEEQPMSRKIIENGHEGSPGYTDKTIKKYVLR